MPSRMRVALFALVLGTWVLGACSKTEEPDARHEPEPSTGYNAIPAAWLNPSGCETYVGAHPTHPNEILCCSNPSSGQAPECGPFDRPDIACVIEYTFCDDGSAVKAWSPDPVTGIPGHTVSTSGSWTLDPDTGELVIVTTAAPMGGAMTMVTTETYPDAFTYDSGNKLDLYSVAAVEIDSAGLGHYHRDASSLTEVGGLWGATLDASMRTDVTVTADGYESTFVQDIVCTPPLGMVCLVTPKSESKVTSGTHERPINLYVTPAGAKMYQTDEAKTLLFERRAGPCTGVDCGEHGTCVDGACVCTDGYTGDFCDVPGPCTGVDCGEHGTCVDGACVCDAGFEGDTCEVDVNECDPNPCLHGGACAEGAPGTYTCTCVGGYTGENCQNCPSDADGDGYGDPASASCVHPERDCDDGHATVYPGAPELCDGLDNQCPGDPGYGAVDEGFSACGAMVPIPPGCFEMGDAFAEGWPDERPVHTVCLSAFEMDRHEITNGEYAECVAAGACTAPRSSASYSRQSYYGDPAYANYPVIWMEWDQVLAYCTWAGKRLPTEAEWEYAARGGLEGKRYPWGDTISSGDANYDMNVGDTTEVESYPPNGYGLHDMAGNVWEWVADWFDENYYAASPTDNPTGPASGQARVRRGGSWDHSAFGLRVATRCDFCHADRHGNNLGGRCAR